MTEAGGLKPAVMWLNLIIREADVDSDETTVKVNVVTPTGPKKALAMVNLGDDLRTFAEMGRRELFCPTLRVRSPWTGQRVGSMVAQP